MAFDKRIVGVFGISLLLMASACNRGDLAGRLGEPARSGWDGKIDVSLMQKVQTVLQAKGYDVGNVVGNFDESTSRALRAFQRDSGLMASGAPDEPTLLALGVKPQQTVAADTGATPVLNESRSAILRLAASEVRQLQTELNERGFEAGPVDGIIGRRTRAALKAFQHSEGLPETGGTDAKTVAYLGVGTAAPIAE
jgi:peptidoglycan hydrolase-like protein with peptidoglycan-binding domain